jgi:hypothetical protein
MDNSDIIDNILSYVKIKDKIFINKYYYKKSKIILKSKVNVITKFYLKNKIRLQMLYEYYDEDNIEAIRNYFILFYPKKYRKITSQYILQFCNNPKLLEYEHKTNYNKYFIYLIKKLDLSILAVIALY